MTPPGINQMIHTLYLSATSYDQPVFSPCQVLYAPSYYFGKGKIPCHSKQTVSLAAVTPAALLCAPYLCPGCVFLTLSHQPPRLIVYGFRHRAPWKNHQFANNAAHPPHH